MKRLVSFIVMIFVLFQSSYIMGYCNEYNNGQETYIILENSEYKENEVLIKYSQINTFSLESYDLTNQEIEDNLTTASNVEIMDTLDTNEEGVVIKQVHVETENIEKTINELMTIPGIEAAEPNYKVYPSMVNDPYFSKQWAYDNQNGYDINVQSVWEKLNNGSDDASETIVAVLDSGIDIYHEDLKDNIFVNVAEKEGQFGIDDDGNKYIDDNVGWDFVFNDNTVYDNITDSTGENMDMHGTHVAGIIAASLNSKGIQGVAHNNTKILPVKFIAGNDGGYISDEIRAINYAESMGAKIANCSFASRGNTSQIEKSVIKNSNMLFVCSAGNDNEDSNINCVSPACYDDLDNVISVCALNATGERATFSNYGVGFVAAPGSNIYSTLPDDNYGYLSGTSMAAPFVTGAAALLCSSNPAIKAKDIKKLIIDGSKPPKTVRLYYGNLDVNGAYTRMVPSYNDEDIDEGYNFGTQMYGGDIQVVDNDIYKIGGYNQNGYITNISRFDFSNNTWVDRMSLTDGIVNTAITKFKDHYDHMDKFIICGGKKSDGNSDTTSVYQIEKNRISSFKNNKSGITAASLINLQNNTIDKRFLIGGVSNGKYSRYVYTHYSAMAYSFDSAMPEERGYFCAESLNNSIYVFGGSNSNGCLTSTCIYNPTSKTWTSGVPTNFYHNNAASLVYNDKIYVFGGTSQYTLDGSDPIIDNSGIIADIPNNVVEVYDPIEKTWTRLADMETARTGHSAFIYNNSAIILGGWNGKFLTDVEYYWGLNIPDVTSSRINEDMSQIAIEWNPVKGADSYDIQFKGQEPIHVTECQFTYDMASTSDRIFRIRACKNGGVATWSKYISVKSGSSISEAKSLNLNEQVSDKMQSFENMKFYEFDVDLTSKLNITASDSENKSRVSFDVLDEFGFKLFSGIIENGTVSASNYILCPGRYYVKIYRRVYDENVIPFSLNVFEGEQDVNNLVPSRVCKNILNATDIYVENQSFLINDENTAPDGPSIELQPENSTEVGINSVSVSYSKSDTLNTTNRYREYTISGVNAGDLLIALLEPPAGHSYMVYFVNNSSNLGTGAIDPFNNNDRIASASFKATSSGSQKIRVTAHSGDYDTNNGNFKLKVYKITNPDNYEANQWQLDANDKDFGNKSSVKFNSIANKIGSTSKYTQGIDAKFEIPSDIDTYPIEITPGEKISVSLELNNNSSDTGTYSISFQRNFSKFGENDNPDGISKDFYIKYSRLDCYNSNNIKIDGKSAYASWIVPNDLQSNIGYIVVQKKNKIMTQGSECPYNLKITKTSAAEMQKDTYEINNGYSNDSISVGTKITASEITLNSSVDGCIDNQLDVDWYKYTPDEDGIKTISLNKTSDNIKMVLYQSGIQMIDNNAKVELKKGSTAYIGVYCEDNGYDNVKNNPLYTISVENENLMNNILSFIPKSGGKFIYSSNPERIDEEYLAENGNMLDNYENLSPGKYTYMAWYHNGTSSPIYTDVLFNSNNAQIRINKLGLQVFPDRDSPRWTGIQAYSDFIGKTIDNSLEMNAHNPSVCYPTILSLPKVYSLNSNVQSMWLSNIYYDSYGNYYPNMNNYNMPIYIIMEFEVLSGSMSLSTIAYKTTSDRTQFILYDAPYIQDVTVATYTSGSPTWKGIAEFNPIVETNLSHTIASSVDTDGYSIPMVVENAFGTVTTGKWVTNLNPQNDESAYKYIAESSMLAFDYSDGYDWRFDTKHTSMKDMPWGYSGSNFIPNDALPYLELPPGDIIPDGEYVGFKKQQISISQGNYSVENVYNIAVTNSTNSTWKFNYKTDSKSGVVVGISANGDEMQYSCSGSFDDVNDPLVKNGRYVGRTVNIPSKSTVNITVSVVLTTGDAGWINNEFYVSKEY